MSQIILEEFSQIAFRKRNYKTPEKIQTDLDAYTVRYSELQTNQNRNCDGRTPMQTFLEGKPLCERYVPKNKFNVEIRKADFGGNQINIRHLCLKQLTQSSHISPL